jgi:phosphoribosylformylglycinamidine cyclo-ligase
MFELKAYRNYSQPALVQCSDGVGTKMEIARLMRKWDTVGIDCVAMCVNDLVCNGAKPITFLDTIICGKNEPEIIYEIIKGVAEGCRQAGCALIGGEMAEHPDMMKPGEYDLQGFASGIVDFSKIAYGRSIAGGDVVIGLKSSGLHSNGFSLIRKIFGQGKSGYDAHAMEDSLHEMLPDSNESLGEWLLRSTKIYVGSVLEAILTTKVKAVAHIAGGGIFENLPRILPKDNQLSVELSFGEMQKYARKYWDVLEYIGRKGGLTYGDLVHTFNPGIGMVLIVDQTAIAEVMMATTDDVEPFVIGRVYEEEGRKVKLIDAPALDVLA